MSKTFKVYNEMVCKVDLDVTEGMTKEDIANAVSEKYYDGNCYKPEVIPDITDIEDEDGNSLIDESWKLREENNEMQNLLRSIIDHVAVGRDTSEQIEELTSMGFSSEMLESFGYSTEDLEEALEEEDEEER